MPIYTLYIGLTLDEAQTLVKLMSTASGMDLRIEQGNVGYRVDYHPNRRITNGALNTLSTYAGGVVAALRYTSNKEA